MNKKSAYLFLWNYNGEQVETAIQAESLRIAEQLLYEQYGIYDYVDVIQPKK